jgi:hypothetical protein
MAKVTIEPKAMPGTVVRVLVGLLPLWIILIQAIAFPGSMDPVTASPPEVAGFPAGVILVASALAVMGLGIEVLRRASSNRVALLAFLGLTVPAAAIVVVAPVLIVIVQTMAA